MVFIFSAALLLKLKAVKVSRNLSIIKYFCARIKEMILSFNIRGGFLAAIWEN